MFKIGDKVKLKKTFQKYFAKIKPKVVGKTGEVETIFMYKGSTDIGVHYAKGLHQTWFVGYLEKVK